MVDILIIQLSKPMLERCAYTDQGKEGYRDRMRRHIDGSACQWACRIMRIVIATEKR